MECKAFNDEEETGDPIDVAYRFKIIISIYFAVGIIDTVRTLFVLLALFFQRPKLAMIH